MVDIAKFILLTSILLFLTMFSIEDKYSKHGFMDKELYDSGQRLLGRGLIKTGYIEADGLNPTSFSLGTNCIDAPPSTGGGLSVRSLTLSIASIEQINRPKVIREVEEFYAKLYFYVTGKIPHMSLGIGQIYPETARLALVNDTDNEQLLFMLIDDCENLRLISIIVENYLKSIKEQDLTLSEQIRKLGVYYNGHPRGLKISRIGYSEALEITYNFIGPDFIWRKHEYDVNTEKPLLFYRGDITKLSNELKNLYLLREVIEDASSHQEIVLLGLSSYDDSDTVNLLKSKLITLTNRLMIGDMPNKMSPAIKPSTILSGNEIMIEVYIGSDPGIVEFIDMSTK